MSVLTCRKVELAFFAVFFYHGFLHEYMVHMAAGEGKGCLFNASLPLQPTSQTLRY